MVAPQQTVVLIHGATATPAVWNQVAAEISPDLDVRTAPLLGHRGGPPWPAGRPVVLEAFLDALVNWLDQNGLDRPHVAGNSLGGWLALELAARQRAASAVAICPAGFWAGADDPDYNRLRRIFARADGDARRARPMLGLLFALAPVRRFGFRNVANRGDRLSRRAALVAVDGVLGCAAYPAMLDTLQPGARSYGSLECPVKVLMGQDDRYFPLDVYRPRVEQRLPDAEIKVLPRVGHVPMIDEPAMIAREITEWVRSAPTNA